uniref:superoxide dismutase n=1 Tax=Closterium ehrenbergii TaxID=102165 RepID=A0A509GHP8_CLOEH|nr:chloroplastic iron superoxide dismutase [Closterium ehrenbergii]
MAAALRGSTAGCVHSGYGGSALRDTRHGASCSRAGASLRGEQHTYSTRLTSANRTATSAHGVATSARRRSCVVVRAVGDHQLPPLPYHLDALEPHISRESLHRHWSVNHQNLLTSLNRQLDADLALKRMPLEELVVAAYNGGNVWPCFHAAAEAWNHEFFFAGMQPADEVPPGEANRPEGEVLRLVERDFGSVQGFEREFRRCAHAVFGSGHVWLSAQVETLVPEEWLADMRIPNAYRLQVARLVVHSTVNAFNPLVMNRIPLLSLDMWEHAYLSDYPTDRTPYVDAFLSRLLSWDAVAGRVERAKAHVNFWEMPPPPDALIRPGFIGDRAIPLQALSSALNSTAAAAAAAAADSSNAGAVN